MNVALMATTPGVLALRFLERHREALENQGVSVPLLVIDENARKRTSPLRHGIQVARRQSKVAGCPTALGFMRILAWKVVNRLSSRGAGDVLPEVPEGVKVLRVPALNSEDVVEAVKGHGCDLVCLMGTRIVTEKTLRGLNVPVINFHSSDPAFMRGAPSVVWEVLAGRDTIDLTIHEVVRRLDAGAILAQRAQPIVYSGGLGATRERTMVQSIETATDLFAEVILRFQAGSLEPRRVEPGPVRVTPGIVQSVRADVLSRRRSRNPRFATIDGRADQPVDSPTRTGAGPLPPSSHMSSSTIRSTGSMTLDEHEPGRERLDSGLEGVDPAAAGTR